ncbi:MULTISPECIES: sulfotransferase family 2 domain-containing protein [unclassified Ruegeria]|uniref:sulfotransferase family 2 domain-containing protein n=1 Tax=unclassified Ruegeria TaxID=2625375 RepID=UPI001AE40337|nr:MULTISPECIES: sulfotransferase family 2 domain-containing protein [unclassified Ruegeria]
MAIVSRVLKAVYFDITKVGSSSLKETFWELDHGEPFKGRGIKRVVNNLHWRLASAKLIPPRNIHEQDGYRTQIFSKAVVPEGYTTFTLVRDPVARIRSAWRDKVHRNQFRWRNEEMDIENEDLPLDPTFGEFIDHFNEYRAVSRPVRVHTTPYSWHLGNDISLFDHVFRLEAVEEMNAFLSNRLGRPFPVQHVNKSGAGRRDNTLTPRQIDALLQITQEDYSLLGDIYDIKMAEKSLAA